jgi:hypothetical protein
MKKTQSGKRWPKKGENLETKESKEKIGKESSHSNQTDSTTILTRYTIKLMTKMNPIQ